MLGDVKTKKPIIYTKSNITIDSKLKLVNHYFNLEFSGSAPFPGYLYRVKSLLNVKLDKENGGKYSDLSFLLKLLEYGRIQWLCKPLMFYRLHNNNDSNSFAKKDRELLMRHLKINNLLTYNIENDLKLILLKEKKKHFQITNFEFYLNALKYLFINILVLRIFKLISARINRMKFI